MGAPDRLHACFGKAEVLNLAFLDQLLHRAGHVFDRHIRIDAVLIEEIDAVGLQALERGLGHLPDVLWPAVKARLCVSGFEAELGGDHHLITEWGEGFADELLVGERTVSFRGIEEGDAALDGRLDQSHPLLLVGSRTVAKAQSHAAQPDGRDFQVTVSKRALVHCVSFQERGTSLIVTASASRPPTLPTILGPHRSYLEWYAASRAACTPGTGSAKVTSRSRPPARM